jgi:hypothetical protein
MRHVISDHASRDLDRASRAAHGVGVGRASRRIERGPSHLCCACDMCSTDKMSAGCCVRAFLCDARHSLLVIDATWPISVGHLSRMTFAFLWRVALDIECGVRFFPR